MKKKIIATLFTVTLMEYGITEDDRVETFRNGGFGSTDKNK